MDKRLLTVSNAKTQKGEPLGYLTGILYLVPHKGSGLGNLCPHASAGCAAACLFTAGRGVMAPIREGRMRKTRLFFEDSAAFVDMLADDVERLYARAHKQGLKLAVRLNGTSDIPWERMHNEDGRTLMELFPYVQFYDYTKRPNRKAIWPNYHLTFSRSETNEDQCGMELASGRNVAVVFDTPRGQALPMWWRGYAVVDGDVSDLRFLDPSHPSGVGVVVGLRAKGRARKGMHGGFVVEVA